MKTDLFFNSGVKPWNNPSLSQGDKFINNEKHILFQVEGEIPAGCTFAFAAQSDNLNQYGNYLVLPIVGGNLASKFAYFKK